MPSSTTPAVSRCRRRESARLVVQRLHAIPVQLLPSHVFAVQGDLSLGDTTTHKHPASSNQPPRLDVAPVAVTAAHGSSSDACAELGMNSVCLVTATSALRPSPTRASAVGEGAFLSTFASPAADQRLAYEVAAAHVLRGGRVLYLSAPASRAFSLTRFVVIVERQWVALQRMDQENGHGHQDETSALQRDRDQRGGSRAGSATKFSALAGALSSTPSIQAFSPEDHLRARQRAVLEAVRRIEVLTCTCMEDFHAVCQAYTFPTDDGESWTTNAAASEEARISSTSAPDYVTHLGNQRRQPMSEAKLSSMPSAFCPYSAYSVERLASATAAPPAPREGSCPVAASDLDGSRDSAAQRAFIVPLCIVDGLMGSMSTPALLERASGQPCPLTHYILCLLQRRLKCALIVLEEEGCAAANSGSGGSSRWSPPSSSRFSSASWLASATAFQGGPPRNSKPFSCSLPSPTKVLAASDLVRRLCVSHLHSCSVPSSFDSCHRRWCLAGVASEGMGVPERQPGKKAGRSASVVENLTLTGSPQAPPVSLHDVQLSVAYVEWSAVWRPLQNGGRNVSTSHARHGPTLSHDPLLLPSSMAWGYRVHLMKTSVEKLSGASMDSAPPFSHNRQNGVTRSYWQPIRSSHRSSGGTGLFPDAPGNHQYTGTWVRSTQWRHL